MKRILVLSVVLTLLSLVAACAQPPVEVREVEKVVKETVVVEKEAAAEEWDGTLVIATTGPVEHWDPAWDSYIRALENTFHLWDRCLMLRKTEEIGGVQVIPGDTLHMVPYLCEKIEIDPDAATVLPADQLDWLEVVEDEEPGGQTAYIAHLRKGIKFPSGNELTAHDVKWTTDYRFLAGRMNDLPVYADANSADTVSVVDDYTVKIIGERPNSLALHMFDQEEIYDSELVMEHATEDDPWGAEWLKTHSAGVGPYVVEKVEGDDVYLVENPDYYAEELGIEEVYPTRLIFKAIPDATQRALLLASGEVDIAENLPPSEIEFLKETPNIEVFTAPTKEFFGVGMGTQTPPFDNKALRQAIAYAIPYQEILDGVFLGSARRAASPIPIDVAYSDPSLSPYEHDLDKARELLEEAGYADGLEVELIISLSNPYMEPAAILIKDSLANIGVDVTIRKLDAAAYAAETRSFEAAFFLASRHAWVAEPEYQLQNLYGTGRDASNWPAFSSERVDEIIKIAPAADEATRAELYREAQEILLDEVPWAWIAHPSFSLAVSEGIEGFVLPNTNIPRYTSFRFAN